MKKILHINYLCLLLLCVMTVTGCVERELEMRPTGDNVVITLDWDKAPLPKVARFVFYDQSGGVFKEYTGITDSYTGTFPDGNYRLVVHNTDAEKVDYKGFDRYETAEIFAQSNVSNPSYILEPQAVYGTGVFHEGEVIEVRSGKTTRATVKPKLLTRHVEFHFTVNGAERVRSLSGVLNGVASSIFVASGEYNNTQSYAIEFTATSITPMMSQGVKLTNTARTAGNNLTARMNVFNLLSTAISPNKTNTIDVVIEFTDGRIYTLEVDLTPTLREIIVENGGQIPIEIPLEVTFETNPISDKMSAAVKAWEEGTGSGGVTN